MAEQFYIDLVQKVYIAYYGRPGDYGGVNFWAEQLEQKGGDLKSIIEAFGNSVESQNLYAGKGYREQVQKIYQQMFGRDPDQEGLDFYVGKLEKGELTLQTIALDVLNGAPKGSEDKGIIDKKLAVAKQFTSSIHEKGNDYSYMGDADAQTVRDMLNQVSANTDVEAFKTKIDEIIDKIHDDIWVGYSEYPSLVWGSGGNDALFMGIRGKGVWVGKLDGSLKVNKAVLVGDGGYQDLASAVVTSDGGVVLGGRYGGNDGYITKLNANLEVVGTVKIGQQTTDENINSVAVRPDGKIVAVGYEYAVADARDAYIVLLNPDMTVAAQRRIDNAALQNSNEEFGSVVVLPDNSIVARAGNKSLVKFDASLNLVKGIEFNAYFEELYVLPDGSIMAISSGGHSLIKMDKDLNVAEVWEFNRGSISNISVAEDGGSMALLTSGRVLKVDMTGTVPKVVDAKYVSNRDGGSVYLNDLMVFGDQVVAHYGNVMMMMDPDIDSDPNLAGNLRVWEEDEKLFMFKKAAETYYPKASPMDLNQGDISIVGSLNFTTYDGSMIVTETGRGVLDA